jgi:4-hydroxybenzoate polyprenyltransferase
MSGGRLETQAQAITFRDQFDSLVQLTRWREHVTFVIPLTLLGALMALQSLQQGVGAIDMRLLAVMAGNLLVVAYAFMINDIEDAPDDAMDPARINKNPVSAGRLSVRMGYNACRVVALITMVLFAMGGTWPFLIGGLTLLLSHFYSWRRVRLKAYPVTDIVSHSLMLSGLLMLAGYFTYHTAPGIAWFVLAGVTLWSVYGQLYNQLRDFDIDKAAGLHNTAIILGPRNTRIAIYLTIVVAMVCLIAAVVQGAFPVWLAGALIASVAISSMISAPKTDMRGSEMVDASALMQVRALIAVNMTILAWLAAVLLTQFSR